MTFMTRNIENLVGSLPAGGSAGNTYTTMTPMNLDMVNQFISDPNKNSGILKSYRVGSHGEGVFNGYKSMFDTMKQAVSSGQMTIADYLSNADKLQTYLTKDWNGMQGGGDAAGRAADSAIKTLTDSGYLTMKNADEFNPASIPFSKDELSKLPKNVLPTESDITGGRIDLNRFPDASAVPLIIQPNPVGENKDESGNVIPPTPKSEEEQAVLDYYSTVNTGQMTPDELKIFYAGKDQALALAGIQAKQRAGRDAAIPELEKYMTGQQQTLSNSLSDVLSKSSSDTFNYELPMLQEKLNSQGLLHGTGLDEALAREKAYLGSQNAERLGQYNTTLGTNIADIMAKAKQANTASDVGAFGDVFNLGNQYSQSGLQRSFSLEDFQREADLAKELGAMNAPKTQPYSGGSMLSGALMGGASGAAAGSVAGPPGAIIGGSAGAIYGALSNRKGGGT